MDNGTQIQKGDRVTHSLFPPVDGIAFSLTEGQNPILTVMRRDGSVYSDSLCNWELVERGNILDIQ